MSDEKPDPSMWATVVEDEYDGSLRWDCHTEGDRGDGDSLPTITLAADTFPAGTTLEIREPARTRTPLELEYRLYNGAWPEEDGLDWSEDKP